MTYDAIVIGVGGMGSATLFHLARSGARVLGLEQFGIPHQFGSSHGSTRIIRLAYSDGDEYVPLLQSAYEYWRELETISGKSILHLTGGLDIGPENSSTIEGSRQSCLTHGLEFEELDNIEINRRFPGYQLPAALQAIYHREGGYLLSEVAVETYAQAAEAEGADVHTGETMRRWKHDAEGLRVETDAGEYHASKLVITAGPWVGNLGVGKLASPLRHLCRAERQVLLWTKTLEPTLFEPVSFPVFNMEAPMGRFYGLPDHQGEGFKIGKYHHLGQQVDDPASVDRECHPEDEAVLREAIKRYFPSANGEARKLTTCLFTNSPDEHFILDRYPGESDVFVATGFSGHGFKFCSVIGKIMTEFCLDQQPSWDIQRFGFKRFQAARARQNESHSV